ncbi:MAG: hypothetical protein ACR2MZ_10980 [Candidatus Dormibacter sp.]
MSAMNVLLPSLSSLVSFVFAGLVLQQWARRRRSFQLVWAVGLLWYGIAAGTEALGSAFGWNPLLYRLWYLIGALYVAAYLGAGTVYLLSKTRFGYVAAVSVLIGGLLMLAFSPLYPGSGPTAWVAFAGAAATSLAMIWATPRGLSGHVLMLFLLAASIAGAALVLTVPLSGQGFAVDPHNHVPVGSAFPPAVRVVTGPFNILGVLCLVLGAKFSFYIYMPKHKVLRARRLAPVLRQIYGFVAVLVNLFASLPGAVPAILRGRVNSRVPATLCIALGAAVPGITSGLDRFGITWAFFLGELLGVLLIFLGFLVSEDVFARRRAAAAPAGTWQPASSAAD